MHRQLHAFAAVVVAAVTVVWAGPARSAEPATRLELQAEPVRSYDIPENFSIQGRIVDSTTEGRTLIANTVSGEESSTCTVVVASGDSARAFPYEHSSEGTRCVGVLAHPDGGFFVRGMAAEAREGDVAGFTARIGAEGNEQWLVRDTRTAESDDFKGSYQEPHPPMAYSSDSNYLLTFTTGKLTLGDVDEKTVTHASVISGDEMTVPAKTLGGSDGFGVIGGVATLESTGNFLLYIYSPGSQGSNFFTYDGRVNVDAFDPMGEDWSERYVRRMIYGPDSNIYLLWSDEPEGGGPTRVSVVDEEAAEVWSESYPSTVVLPKDRPPIPDSFDVGDVGDVDVAGLKSDTKEVELGAPAAIWAGSEHVVILYAADAPYLRVIEADTGEAVGVAPLADAIELTPINIIGGKDGRLKLLAVDGDNARFHELSLDFEVGETAEIGDAGHPDGGLADAGDAGDTSGGGGDSGCSTNGEAPPLGPTGALWLLAAFGLRARGRIFDNGG